MVTLYYATWDADALRLAEALRKKAATLHGAGGPAAASIQFQDVDELEDDADLPDAVDNHAALPFATVKAKDVEIFVSKQEMAAKLEANNNWAACDSLLAYFESLSQSVENAAKTKYKQAALEPGTTFGGNTSGCCNPGRDYAQVSKQLGYTDTEVSHEANLGLGCGNPLSFADLQPGETVMDLGCGAGFDCFLAADKVANNVVLTDEEPPRRGHVIGVDMTPEMLQRARATLLKNKNSAEKKPLIEFRLGELDHLPCGDGVVDCIISNCVINLCADKQQVYREMARVLRPDGRIAISDVVKLSEEDLPSALKSDESYAC